MPAATCLCSLERRIEATQGKVVHKQQRNYCLSVKERFPEYFAGTRVVDFGSLDINGNNRYLFEGCNYVGVDLGIGENVDYVCRAHQYRPAHPVDVVISTEMLEHDEFWLESIINGYRILRPGGLLLFTCATPPRREHGTRRTNPDDAPFVGDYYRNITEKDLHENFNLDSMFNPWEMRTEESPGDLYFCGVKR